MFFTHDPDTSFGWLDDYFLGLAGETHVTLSAACRVRRARQRHRRAGAGARRLHGRLHRRVLATTDAYLDEAVRANMSTFALLDERVVADGVARLARDLADRSWQRRYAALLAFRQLDVGYRLVVAELT